jgi:hypothetical protein
VDVALIRGGRVDGQRAEQRAPGFLKQHRSLLESEPAAAELGLGLRRPDARSPGLRLQVEPESIREPFGEGLLLARDYDPVDEVPDPALPLADSVGQREVESQCGSPRPAFA